ncbi:MAG: HNH endonuclease [Verrucomicrobiaceae bacterium]|nr:MAG: HNH endonuclease [Verrucomicrobiaceae bacterium]
MSHTLALNQNGQPIGVLPLSTLSWQDAVRAVYLDTVESLHFYEDWTVNSPSCRIRIPSVVIAREYVNIRRFVGFSPEMVNLRDEYKCAYCSGRFNSAHLTMDHVVPKSRGGMLTFSNIVSACAPCNSKRGNDVRVQPKFAPYRPTYYELMAKRKRYPVSVPHASWIPYIDWDDPSLIKIEPPVGAPGYHAPTELIIPDGQDEDDALMRNILLKQA